ncbi:MAG: caspase family protein [Cyanobacteriota bacterium]|nr:caspase family protein [Cyanobacteriota bacterium]
MSEDSPKRIALVLNTLTNGELKGGKRDVSRVYSILTNPQQGMCLPNGPTPIHDCQNREQFEKILKSTLKNWDIKTQLVFYFSGHGDIRGNNQYCLKMGLDNLEWYPFKNLMNELDMAGVQRAIIILDACHSGAAVEGNKNLDDNIFNSIKKDDIPQGIAIISSSRKTQKSKELPDGSSGLFTDIFCRGIETSLDGKGTNDGKIYVEDIVNYIENKLSTEEKYSTFTQRPVFSLDRAEKKIWIAQGKKREYSTPVNVKSSHSIRTPEELKILYEQTHPNRHPCPEATIEDIDLEVLEKYANKVEPELYKTANLEEVLSKLKLYSPIQDGSRNVLHKSAVLCFHKRPEMIYPQARSVFVFGRPRESNFVRQDIFGPLSFQVEALVERVKKYSETISYIAEDGLRREVQEIDLRVARELISNAIAHRDYQLTGTVKVTITPEALEVYSPGTFSPGLSWEQLIDDTEPLSSPVDEAISLYLVNLLVFEGIGRGFDVFKEYIKENDSDSILSKELSGPTTYIRVLSRAKNQRLIYSLKSAGIEVFKEATNPEVFTPREETKQIVTKRRIIRHSEKIYNRKVYMLIDQSGSMVRRDLLFNNERRWKAIAEVTEGHVYNILNQEGINGEKICDEITVTFFSQNRPSTLIRAIQDDSQVPALFKENKPDSNTFLSPTFQQIVEQWFDTRMENEGGFIIIYTDGEIDDLDAFVNYVKETCQKLNNQDELKIVIIGFGSDVNRDPIFYLKLDANTRSFTDRNSKSCQIVVFDLLNKMPNIIELLNRQLEDPKAGLPDWGKDFCPELYD